MKKSKALHIAVAIFIPLAVGIAASLISRGFDSFEKINKPFLSPPAWLFPIVWTLLYIAMGYASYRVYEYGENKKIALIAYGLQLALNFLWPLLFLKHRNIFMR